MQIDFGRTAISDVTGVLANLGTNLPDNVALAATGTATDESDLTFTKAFDKARIQTQLSESMVSSPAILASALASTLTSDRPDGLWTTMVVDERRLSLGLAYSSNESLTAAMDKRRGMCVARQCCAQQLDCNLAALADTNHESEVFGLRARRLGHHRIFWRSRWTAIATR